MNAPLDDIYTFLGNITPEEYEQRRRIRVCLSIACQKLATTKSQHAMTLCNLVNETAIFWRYRPAELDALDYAVTYMRGLLSLADAAEHVQWAAAA